MRWTALFLFALCCTAAQAADYTFDQFQVVAESPLAGTDTDLAYTEGAWVAVWCGVYGSSVVNEDTGSPEGKNQEIFFSRSVDAGTTWSQPALLKTSFSTNGDDLEPRIAANNSGTLIVVWRSTDNLGGTVGNDRDILFARSTDAGATWSDPKGLAPNAASDYSEDYTPSIASNGGNVWVATWNHGHDLCIYSSYSIDNGATWSTPANVSGNNSVGNPLVTYAGTNNWIITWHGTYLGLNGVYYSFTNDNGQIWSAPMLMTISPVPGSIAAVCMGLASNRDGTALATVVSHTSTSTNPVLTVFRTLNAGMTWSQPEQFAVHPSDLTFGWAYARPMVGTDAQGRWFIVWASVDPAAAPDSDLLVVKSTNLGYTWSAPDYLSSHDVGDDLINPAAAFRSWGIATDNHGTLMVVYCGLTRGGVQEVHMQKASLIGNSVGPWWTRLD